MSCFHEQALIGVEAAGAKCMRRPSHANTPNAIRTVIGQASRLSGVFFQSLYPVMQGKSIVLSQVLEVT